MISGYTSNERDKPTGVRCAKAVGGGVVPAFKPKAAGSQTTAYTGTAGTTANPLKAKVVSVMVTTLAHIRISGSGVAATTADQIMPANVIQYFNINYGDKISAIQSAAGGNMYVCEME